MRHGVLFAVLFTTSMTVAQTRFPSAALLDVFPASGAPSFLTTASEFAVSSQFAPIAACPEALARPKRKVGKPLTKGVLLVTHQSIIPAATFSCQEISPIPNINPVPFHSKPKFPTKPGNCGSTRSRTLGNPY